MRALDERGRNFFGFFPVWSRAKTAAGRYYWLETVTVGQRRRTCVVISNFKTVVFEKRAFDL